MAGWKTEQIIGGMPGLLQLAAAGGTDLATTADIVSDGMTAMGLVAGQKIPNAFGQMVDSTTHFADVMAATSSGANTNVQMMGETFKYAASVAGSLGYSIDDVALATGLMANAGVKGSMAGTALRSIMTRMAKPTKESQTAMDKLGLSLTDSQGKMKPFKQIMDDMREGFAKLTPAEQAETAAMLAGQEAMSGALAIATASAKDYNTLADSIAKSDGAAKAMSDTMTDNLEGSLKAFESASEAVSISLGQAFEPATRAAVNFGTEAAQGLKEFIANNQTAVQWAGLLAAGLAGVTVATAGAALAMSAWGFATTTISSLRAAVAGLTVVQYAQTAATKIAAGAQWLLNAAMSANPVGLMVGGVLALVAALGYVIATVPGVSQALSNAWNDPQGAIHGFTSLAKSLIDDAVNYVVDRWETLKQALSHPIDAIINFLDHGDVTGGNVKSGEQIRAQSVAAPSGGGTFSQAAQIDTSQAQAQVNGLGEASNSAATSTQSLAQNIETNSVGAQTLNTNLQTAGEGITNFANNVTGVGEGITNLQTNLTSTGEGFNQVTTNAQTTSAEFTNLTANAQQVSPALQQLQQSASSAAPALQQVGSSASSASSGLSQISSAAGSVASALQAKASQISSISISAPKVAANAKGGIYKQGAFLTTFAEKSPEAAIPLDNSQRAKDLWTQAGQALGMIEGNKPVEQTPDSSVAEKIFSRRVDEVNKMRQKISGTEVSDKKISAPETKIETLSAEEKIILQRAAQEYQTTGRANLPAPTETSSAEYKKRYENHQKLSQATKYLPQTSTVPQNKTSTTSKQISRGGSIFSKPRSATPKQNNLPTAPNFNPSMPRQKNNSSFLTPNSSVFNPTSSLNETVDKIFSGSIKLPRSSDFTKSHNNHKNLSQFDVDGSLGGLLKNFTFTAPSENGMTDLSTQPPITVNITINGKADAETMQQAGNELAINLRREMDDWWRDKGFEDQRRSFI